jgi:hypothetical protein
MSLKQIKNKNSRRNKKFKFLLIMISNMMKKNCKLKLEKFIQTINQEWMLRVKLIRILIDLLKCLKIPKLTQKSRKYKIWTYDAINDFRN